MYSCLSVKTSFGAVFLKHSFLAAPAAPVISQLRKKKITSICLSTDAELHYFLSYFTCLKIQAGMHGNARWASCKLVIPMYMKAEGYVPLDDKLMEKSTYIKGLIH